MLGAFLLRQFLRLSPGAGMDRAAMKSFFFFFAFISFYLQVIKPLYCAVDPEVLGLCLLLAA